MKSRRVTGSGRAQLETYFAPAGRADAATLKKEIKVISQDRIMQAVEEAIDGYLLILNHERQVLAANKQFLQDLGLDSCEGLVGKRPGEILECIHASTGPDGCGTAKACAACGAVLSILASQEQQRSVSGECLLTIQRDSHTESLEFRVRATPVEVQGQKFSVVVFNDISGEKRRDALERIFFHDILNTIGGLVGWSTMLQSGEELDVRLAAQKIASLSERLAREVRDQRQLLQAEQGELVVAFDRVSVGEILETVRSVFSAHEAAKGKQVDIGESGRDDWIRTDSSLLLRVLTNMIKNALEAVKDGETVRVWYEKQDDGPVFLVWNRGLIPEDVQMRIFQRSFSTKAKKGRGLGTYSMKLFGERYLNGKVGFESTEEKGTTFFIQLPGESMHGRPRGRHPQRLGSD